MKKNTLILIAFISAAAFVSSCTGDRVPEANVDTVNSNYGKMTGANNIDTGVIASRDFSGAGGDRGLKDTSGKLGAYKAKPAVAATAAPDTAKKDTTKVKK